LDDLNAVAPGVAKVQPTAREDLDVGRSERVAQRRPIVDDEPEVAFAVAGPPMRCGERQELVAGVEESHPRAVAPTGVERHQAPVEREGRIDVVDL